MALRYPQPDNERTFEKFCLKFLRRHWNNPHLELYGKRGEEQVGIDIIDMSDSTPFRAGQCKHHEPHKTIPRSEIQKEVDKALEFDPPIEHFAILTTAKASTQAQNAIIKINRDHKTNNIKMFVELFQWDKIEDFLDDYPEIVNHLVQPTNSNLKSLEINQGQLIEQFRNLRWEVFAKVEEVVAVTGSNQFDAEIDEAETHIQKHDPQVARIHLERIRKRHWETLSDLQKYRVWAALANAAFSLGEDIEAGKILIQAKVFQPEAERALINEAIGYEFLRKNDTAHELAKGLMETYPNSGPLLSCWIRTAPANLSLDAIQERVNPLTESDAQVNVALAIRCLENKRYEQAEGFARKAIGAVPDWIGPKSLLGQILVNIALGRQRNLKGRKADQQKELYIESAVDVLTETIALAGNQGTLRNVV